MESCEEPQFLSRNDFKNNTIKRWSLSGAHSGSAELRRQRLSFGVDVAARICGVGHCIEESCVEKGLEGYKPGFSVDFSRELGCT